MRVIYFSSDIKQNIPVVSAKYKKRNSAQNPQNNQVFVLNNKFFHTYKTTKHTYKNQLLQNVTNIKGILEDNRNSTM